MRRELLAKATSGGSLDRDEAKEVAREMAAGAADPVLIAALLGALAARGETETELAGFAEAFRAEMSPFPAFPDAIDTCGTGGDGKGTFNLSTAAALTVAAMGVAVAKHGNRSVSSACGSADLLEAVGYPISEAAGDAALRLKTHHFAFLLAPKYHPALAHLAVVRRTLGIRTVFNLLGPLLNPARVRRQVIGASSLASMSVIAGTLKLLGTARAFVICSDSGADEVTLEGSTHVIEVRGSESHRSCLMAADFGLPPGAPTDVRGSGAAENARLLRRLAEGTAPAGLQNAAAANAALAQRVAGACEDLREGTARALGVFTNGKLGELLRQLTALPRREVEHAPLP